MFLKGSTINNFGHARKMAAHLFKDENEKITVRESLTGTSRKAVETELVAMQKYAELTRGKEGIFSVAISPRENESLNDEQLDRAVEMIEDRFKLEGQQKIIIDHVKDGRAHSHVLWSKVDIENCKLIPTNNYKLILKDMARQMEREFNHEQTPSRYTDKTLEMTNADRMRDGRRTADKKEQRTSVERKRLMGQLWQGAKTPDHFIAMAKDEGYAIARGDKAAFVVIDQDGEVSSLARDLPKTIRKKDVENRFQFLETPLPTAAQVLESINTPEQGQKIKPEFESAATKVEKEQQRERSEDQGKESETVKPEFQDATREPEAEIFDRDDYERRWQLKIGDDAIKADEKRRKEQKESKEQAHQVRAAQVKLKQETEQREARRKKLVAGREKWEVGVKSNIKREFAEEVHDRELTELTPVNDNKPEKNGPNVREGESYITKDFNDLTPNEKRAYRKEEKSKERERLKELRRSRAEQAKDKDQGQDMGMETS